MSKKSSFILLFFITYLLCGVNSFAQSRKQLERKRKLLTKEIKKVERILFQTKEKKSDALDDLKDLEHKIDIRNKLIKTILLESKSIATEIKENEREIRSLKKQLNALKKDYADMVFKTYKSKSQQSKTMFLLSSKDFHQAYKRLKYMNQYKEFRKKQGKQIIVKRELVERKTDTLKFQKFEKDKLLEFQKKEQKKIESEKKLQEELIAEIKKEESKYKEKLDKKHEEEKRIASKIDAIIRAEIAKSNKDKKKKAKVFLLNTEKKKLAASFEKNKGKLPWPVNDGLITRKFGVQRHPSLKSIKINSTGLHIQTSKDKTAKSIFKGEILAIQNLSEGRKSVMIQHGNYITAYNNLAKVFVKKGQKVQIGERIGEIFTDKITGKTKLVFVLYKNLTRLDPEKWML